MSCSLKSIGYWCLLIGCFTIGVLLIGAFLLLWSIQVNFAFSTENVIGLATGVIFLAMFFLFYENRVYFPLKKPDNKKEENALDKIKEDFYPIKIELNTNLHGLPVTHACGAPSSICLAAIQINRYSCSREKDYEKIFYDSLTNKIVEYDKTKPDHRELNENFLWILESGKLPPPKSYMEQYNIVHCETGGETRTTIH